MKKKRSTIRRVGTATVVLALLCLVIACSQDDGLASATGGQALTFSVSTDDYNGTRGVPRVALSGTAGVLGYSYDKELGWGDGQTPDMMYNDAVIGSGTEWKTSHAYTPNTSHKMKFYAYFPYRSNIDSEDGMLYFNGGLGDSFSGVPYFKYTSPLTASEQEDLMFAVSDEVESTADAELAPVTLHFHHLLSAVKFTIKNGFDNGTITNIKLKNVRYQGSFNFANTTWTSIDDDTKADFSQNLNVKISTVNTNVIALTGVTQWFMLVPQTLPNSAQLELTYNNGDQDFVLTYNLGDGVEVDDGAGGTTVKKLTFAQGKTTTLNLNVESITRMTVKATVTDWEHGFNFNGGDSDMTGLEVGAEVDDWSDTYTDENGDEQSTTTDVQTGPQ